MAPDLNTLRIISKENLSRAMRLIRGKKIVVIDSKLASTLDLVANFRFLQDHGVERVVQLDKSSPPLNSNSVNQCLYFIRADLISAKLVCDQINSNLARGENFTYGVIVIPRMLNIITSLFESEGIYEHITFGQYAYELLPLDDNILTLQFEDVTQQLWLHEDTSILAAIAKAIFNIRGIYGDFHHIVAMGKYSNAIIRMQMEFERIHAHNLKAHHQPISEMPTLVLMDRSQDFVTPLLTPLNYEGMLDEVFGIKGKTIVFGSEVTGKEPTKQVLSSSDPIFEKVRNLHFSRVVSFLIAKEKEIRRDQDESAGLNLQGMKKFVQKELQQIQSQKKTLALHLGAVDAILKDKSSGIKKLIDVQGNILENVESRETQNFLEEAMAKGFDQTDVLRLFCLCTLAQDGLRDSKSLKTQFMQSYGFKHLITLNNLESMGLLYNFRGIEVNAKSVAQAMTRVANSAPFISSSSHSERSRKTNVPFQAVLKKLVPSVDVDVAVQSHSSYVFNGKHTPFISKITEEILSVITAPNSNSAIVERKLEDLMKFYHISDKLIKCKSANEAYSRGRSALVFIVGGITRSEIAALQVVARDRGFNIFCAGTDITNGRKIVNSSLSP